MEDRGVKGDRKFRGAGVTGRRDRRVREDRVVMGRQGRQGVRGDRGVRGGFYIYMDRIDRA